MLLRWIRWGLGYVEFSIHGKEPERFLNRAARDHFHLWGIRKETRDEKEILLACVRKKAYPLLRPQAKRSQTRLRVEKRIGLPFLCRRWKGKRGLLYGGAAGVAILLLLSMRVWCIHVQGLETVDPARVKQAAYSLGLKQGMLRSEVDSRLLQTQLMQEIPELSWVSVNTWGSLVTIEARERIVTDPVEDQEGIFNIVASGAGQIVRMEVYHGTAEVQIGDAVAPGQLLVNGITGLETGGSLPSHAAAKVIARTKRTFSAEVPFQQTIRQPTGETVTRRTLRVFGASIPLSLEGRPDGPYTRTLEESPLVLNNMELPVSVYTETFTLEEEIPATLTAEQAREQAMEQIRAQQQDALSGSGEDGAVVSQEVYESVQDGKLVLTAECVCEEDIAQEQEVLWEKT